ncbi:MAG: HAMP domain-containing protein [Nitrospirae bacterium]|nr:HAMP domain-containing protein [Nitrospirota bacterium]
MLRNRVFIYSIRWKFLFATVGLIISLLMILTYIQISSQRTIIKGELDNRVKIIKDSMIDRAKTLSGSLRVIVEESIVTFDISGIIKQTDKSVKESKDLSYIILMDYNSVAHIHTLNPGLRQSKLVGKEDEFAATRHEEAINEFVKDGIQYMELIVPVRFASNPWGVLRLGYSLRNLNRVIEDSRNTIKRQTRAMILHSIMIAILFVLLSSIIVLMLSGTLTNPIISLTRTAQELAQGHFTDTGKITVRSQDEVGILTYTFMDMANKIKTSHEQLEEYNRTLELRVEKRTSELQETLDERNKALDERNNALKELKESQERLIQSEKMAALGQLVAGVAHEINTPIGIAITTSSYLEEETKKTIVLFDNRTLNKNMLEKYLSDAQSANNLVVNNLLRAGNLIKSFKMVSADQTSWDKRKFNLNSYLNDIVTSLRPNVRKTSHNITINCPEVIEINSYPGVFAQIFTNLILNSLSHAYNNDDMGNIRIYVSIAGENLVLKYSDDGKGIPEANLKKIFDPFFTTKRGQGGTGLGLNIVFNIIDQTLKGNIECESVEGQGTVFTITVPLTIP